MALTMKKFARVAAIGALGVAAVVVALYLLIAIGGGHSATSGIDATQGVLLWLGAGIPAAAIIAVHVTYARQLLRYASEHRSESPD
ncbi:MAG: hypothetical protein MNPFHGCM_01251 [Gemmatimonadaceae bacterium]|nr:hypothetical protein [Gemmatimonadaceae bacterium]